MGLELPNFADGNVSGPRCTPTHPVQHSFFRGSRRVFDTQLACRSEYLGRHQPEGCAWPPIVAGEEGYSPAQVLPICQGSRHGQEHSFAPSCTRPLLQLLLDVLLLLRILLGLPGPLEPPSLHPHGLASPTPPLTPCVFGARLFFPVEVACHLVGVFFPRGLIFRVSLRVALGPWVQDLGSKALDPMPWIPTPGTFGSKALDLEP